MNRPIFVLSTGRCGTFALQQFFQRSNECEAFHRYRGRGSKYRNDMSVVLEQNYAYYNVLRDPDCDLRVKRFIVRNLRRSRSSLMRTVLQEGRKFIELNHEFSPFGSLLLEAFPEASFVHLVRHPKAVISSFIQKVPSMSLPAFMGTRYSVLGQYVLRYGRVRALSKLGPRVVQAFVKSHQFDTHLHPFRKINGTWQEKYELSVFERTCWYWTKINRIIMECFDQLPEERRLRISFEEIFLAPSDEGRKALLDFVSIGGLTVEDMGVFFKTKFNPKVAHYPFPSPEKWDDITKQVFGRYCSETAEQLGYS